MIQSASWEPELCLSNSFLLHDVAEPVAPLILASPHSGRAYPQSFLGQSRLDLISLRRSEDAYVDLLFEASPSWGIPLLCAQFPRAYCDANRYAWELDPGMFRERLPEGSLTNTAKVRSGLGMMARIAGPGRGIYRYQLPVSEASQRIASCWLPYHEALEGMIERCKSRFGTCVLLDLHSMPTIPHLRLPDIILGDLHGTSCAPEIVEGVAHRLGAQGFSVGRNRPYAGGYITERYGTPDWQVHVIQVEISRRLYLDEPTIRPSPDFASLRARLENALSGIIELAGAFRTYRKPCDNRCIG
ncbi:MULTISPECIES: N-formylglutamate amidohydrolase [Asaia]|uniref:N-formylglutamate deformylase n=1 Tax=Asaia bogorensis TaxID=91915 RepID=A0A060QFA9_9PROT|nr:MULTISPECIES: N-formylglutamate amidohydrolase [Asaia]ETC99893.1 N-formylglutamate amidohydrolase [Asaia sp. SF2.1]CDG39373.1 N-formylglutamate deformylase [Asaia bogorensis]